MSWTRKKVLVTVKAYPTESKKHGSTVCAAGITDTGEWIRLYPIPFATFFKRSQQFKKYTWIEVECKKASEKLSRKESYKVNPRTIKVLDDSLTVPQVDWKGRNELILPMLNKSMKELYDLWKEDRTSLGLVRPKAILDFQLDKIKDKADEDSTVQMDLFGGKALIAEPMNAVFRYKFACDDSRCKGNHRILCEDWELGEAWRSWSYPTRKILLEKIKKRFYVDMVRKRNLHFFMGMYYDQPTWLIIGLYYPPKDL